MKKGQSPTMDLFSKTKLFIALASCNYDLLDKQRFLKMNLLFDQLRTPNFHHPIQAILTSKAEINPKRITLLLNELDIYYKNHLNKLSKTAMKKEIQWIKASVKLYYKIDEILNRVDIIQIAFLLRDSEYDIYNQRIAQNLNNPMFQSIGKIKKYLIKNIALGNCEDLDEMGYWGEMSNSEYVPTIMLNNHDTSETDNSASCEWIPKPQRGRRRKKIRLEERIEWGAGKIFQLLENYKRHYAGHFN